MEVEGGGCRAGEGGKVSDLGTADLGVFVGELG